MLLIGWCLVLLHLYVISLKLLLIVMMPMADYSRCGQEHGRRWIMAGLEQGEQQIEARLGRG